MFQDNKKLSALIVFENEKHRHREQRDKRDEKRNERIYEVVRIFELMCYSDLLLVAVSVSSSLDGLWENCWYRIGGMNAFEICDNHDPHTYMRYQSANKVL